MSGRRPTEPHPVPCSLVEIVGDEVNDDVNQEDCNSQFGHASDEIDDACRYCRGDDLPRDRLGDAP